MNLEAEAAMAEVLSMPMRDGVAVDGGSHIGRWAIEMSRKFKKVFAYEPNPENFQRLSHNTKNINNTHIECKALGWVDGSKVKMGLRLADKTDTSRIVDIGDGAETVTLDAECGGRDVAFIKLDLEGFEYHALRGGEQTLKRCRPTILLEEKDGLSEYYGVPTGVAVEWLESIGMKVSKRFKIDVLMEWR